MVSNIWGSSQQQLVLRRQAELPLWRVGHLHRSSRSQRWSVATCRAQASPGSDLTALVIGSGFAGLSAAARLSRHFAEVVRAPFYELNMSN